MATWTFISPLWTFFSHLWIPQENYKMDYLEDDNLDQMMASFSLGYDEEMDGHGTFQFRKLQKISDNHSDSYSEALLGVPTLMG